MIKRALFVLGVMFTLGESGAAADASSLELKPCQIPGIEKALLCGVLPVPENPARPDGRKIELHIVVLPALQKDSQRVPLFDLAGGPGIAASGGAPFFATAGQIHRQHRDVVLVDQRGTGQSHPLPCPEIESASPLSAMYPVDAVRRCRRELEREADLTQYTTRNSARDLDAVRGALGYPKIDISALSYGTRLALTYLRAYPQHVRSAALIGTLSDDAKVPLNHGRNAQKTLDDVFRDCTEDVACQQAFPDLARRWQTVLQSVGAGTTATDSADGRESKVLLSRGPFAEAFRTMLVTTSGQRQIPFQVDHMSRGDFQPFLSRTLHGGNQTFAEGLLLSITCAEDMAWITPDERHRAAQGTFLGTYRIDEQGRACKEWAVPAVKLAQPTMPVAVPVLFLAGDRDYVTPPAWAAKVAAGFPNSRVLAIPKLGHFPDGLDHMECFDAVMNDFFERGAVDKIDTACISTMAAPAFVIAETAEKH
jgi:pimeloyl-ACP methyl ester carboxylesterase